MLYCLYFTFLTFFAQRPATATTQITHRSHSLAASFSTFSIGSFAMQNRAKLNGSAIVLAFAARKINVKSTN